MINPLGWFKSGIVWFKEGIPLKGKIIIATLLFMIFSGGGYIAFRFYDFTQNNPKFCVSCHLMKPAFAAWEKSEHKNINCHDCHRLSIPEQNRLLINFILYRPTKVPERHGKIIVPWKYCINCHWEKNERFPDAYKINKSRIHAKHFFIEKLECSRCHGYIVHKFTPDERFCTMCHKDRKVHGTGMERLACLNCHTDTTPDLKPGRKKCLFCHGEEKIRKELIADATIDIKYFKPDKKTIEKAIKIDVPPDAPMQFFCYECHKPHETVRPDWGHCLDCHKVIPDVGKHPIHIKIVGMTCKQCHKPHSWKVTKVSAKEDCTICHEYKDPKSFIQ